MNKNGRKKGKNNRKSDVNQSMQVASKPLFKTVLPFLASALMLSVIQAPIDLSFLAWISYVPFLLAAYYLPNQNIRPRRLFFVIYIVASVYWLCALHWLTPITIAGWLVLCLYTGLLWPLLYFCLKYFIKKKVPLFLASAILIVGIERMQGLFLGGFFWRFLAHSQYENITIIQIADIFGAGGLSFLIAMVNGIIAEFVIFVWSTYKKQHGLKPILLVVKTGIVLLLVISAVLYGRWRIGQEADCVKEGPIAASMQSNIPQSVKDNFESGTEIFDSLMSDSIEASLHHPDLIVWPETMVQGILNPEILEFREDTHNSVILDKKLREYAKNNAYFLIGGYGGSPEITENRDIVIGDGYNTAFLYKKDGSKAPQIYNKIHLVPFGEVLPLRKSMAWFYQILMNLDFIPYEFDYSLSYGTDYTVFEMEQNDEQIYKFSVIICYEDSVPGLTRKFVLDENGKKQIDWLVNISNDGWFVKWTNDKIIPTAELPQHASICTFRAVENRLAILRSVNTGISCLIDSYGRIIDEYDAGTLPKNAMERTGMSGWFIDTIPIDTRTTLFSKYGEWLDYFCEFCFFFVIIISLTSKFVRFKKR